MLKPNTVCWHMYKAPKPPRKKLQHNKGCAMMWKNFQDDPSTFDTFVTQNKFTIYLANRDQILVLYLASIQDTGTKKYKKITKHHKGCFRSVLIFPDFLNCLELSKTRKSIRNCLLSYFWVKHSKQVKKKFKDKQHCISLQSVFQEFWAKTGP